MTRSTGNFVTRDLIRSTEEPSTPLLQQAAGAAQGRRTRLVNQRTGGKTCRPYFWRFFRIGPIRAEGSLRECLFDRRLDPDKGLGSVHVDERRLTLERHLDRSLTVAADEMARTHVALDRH